MNVLGRAERLTETCTVRVTLEGFPERVQEIADVLEQAIPNMFDWHDYAIVNGKAEIVLKGSTARESS